ncbi:MAG: methylated-DNA--[protein]-cysteine S-methyltransferase [Vicinamibacterales bacterium]
MEYTTLDSPVGPLLLAGDAAALRLLWFVRGRHVATPAPDWIDAPGHFREAVAQLTAYFAGRLRTFDLPVEPAGTPFQRRVWRALQDIPYGETESYGALAQRLGDAKAVRAVGLANGANPISIVIPCHRVIGASGALVGYGGGLPAKRALLDLEQGQRALL